MGNRVESQLRQRCATQHNPRCICWVFECFHVGTIKKKCRQLCVLLLVLKILKNAAMSSLYAFCDCFNSPNVSLSGKEGLTIMDSMCVGGGGWVCVHVCVSMCACVCVYVCACVCVCVCVRVRVYASERSSTLFMQLFHSVYAF